MATFCPQTLQHATCHVHKCPSDHKTQVCVPCAVLCTSPATYYAHIESPKHQQSLRATAASDANPPRLWCSVCETTLYGDTEWAAHVAGSAHESAAGKAGYDKNALFWPVDLEENDSYRCPFCRKSLAQVVMQQHIRGAAHLVRQRAAQGLAEIARVEREYGAEVSRLDTGVDFGQTSVADGAKGQKMEVLVKNVSTETLRIVCVKVARPFRASFCGNGGEIAPGASATVRIKFHHDKPGVYGDRVEIMLQRGSEDSFTVSRKLLAVIKDLQKDASMPTRTVQVKSVQKPRKGLVSPGPESEVVSLVEAIAISGHETSSSAESDEESSSESGAQSSDDADTFTRSQCACKHSALYRSVEVQTC